jgi:hypothetical protein
LDIVLIDYLLAFQLYLDYIDCISIIPDLQARSQDAVLDAVEADQLEHSVALVPRLIQMLPANLPDRTNWRHNVCLARMLSKLLELQIPSVCLGVLPSTIASRSLPHAPNDLQISQLSVPGGLVSEATKLGYIQSMALERFAQTLQAVA